MILKVRYLSKSCRAFYRKVRWNISIFVYCYTRIIEYTEIPIM